MNFAETTRIETIAARIRNRLKHLHRDTDFKERVFLTDINAELQSVLADYGIKGVANRTGRKTEVA